MFAYRSILREQARPAVIRHHARHLADGLARHLGSQSYPAGNNGYSGTEQARPAFGVLAAAVATAAVIVAATRTQARGQPIGPGEGEPPSAFH